jgi:drug/metabolite transporter (DMT)-like permease
MNEQPNCYQNKGLIFAFVAYAIFSFSDVLIKLVGVTYNGFEILGFTSFLPVIALFLYSKKNPNKLNLKSKKYLPHLWRSLILFCSGLITCTVLPKINITHFYSIVFTVPFWSTIIGGLVLKQRFRLPEIIGIVIGFSGMLIAIQPTNIEGSPLIWLLLISPMLFSMAQIMVVSLDKDDNPICFGFYPRLFSSVVILIPLLFTLDKSPPFFDIMIFSVIGTGNIIGMILLGQSYRLIRASQAGFVQYSQIIWGIIFGYLIWGEVINTVEVIGIITITLGGLIMQLKDFSSYRYFKILRY